MATNDFGHGLISITTARTHAISTSTGYQDRPLNETIAITNDMMLKEFRLHFTTGKAGGSTFTMTIDRVLGADYDIKLYHVAMTSYSDLWLKPEARLRAGDKLAVAFTNPSTYKWGMEAVFQKLD
jgi:hypothetical protein